MAGSSRALAGGAFVVSLCLAGGAAYALDQATTEESSSALPQPTSSPTPSPTPSESPSPTATVTPSPTASPTPSATPSATPSPTSSPTARATASPAATVKTYAYPRPTKGYQGLYVVSAEAGQIAPSSKIVRLTLQAKDGDGTIYVESINWGDGTSSGAEGNPTSCRSYPSPTSQPGPYQPQPDTKNVSTTHTYAEYGIYNVTVTLRSVNADCRPYGPKAETTNASFTGDDAVVVAD